MTFELDPLPFAEDALEPYISARTVNFHYNKHHKGYVSKLNDALADDDERRDASLEDIISTSDGHVFNCAAQVWNHTFYWQSLDAGNSTSPSSELQHQINNDFGDIEALKDALQDAGAGEFGSGWAWLCWEPNERKLFVTSTTDAQTPLTSDATPLLTIDVWEHAYYLDYQNDRGAYIRSLLDNIINWDFANANFAKA
ncbi:MAG: superoxide dismutase [Pseudomonadaceae bacterium]|nr:superoxide dismutase [Pseudomonadaceae bacterium]